MHTARRYVSVAGLMVIAMSCTSWPASAARTAGEESGKQTKLAMHSHLGSYLAGRIARGLRDTAVAVDFYRHALKDGVLTRRIIERAFLMEATEGNWEEATRNARMLLLTQPNNRLARLWLGVATFRKGDFENSDAHFERASVGPLGELTSAMARSWVAVARKQNKQAYQFLKLQRPADYSRHFLQYHRALIADLAGDSKRARQGYREIFRVDARTPRTTAAYIRHAVYGGNYKLAAKIARTHFERSSNNGHASIVSLYEDVRAGHKSELIVQSAADGLAEAFYGLGEALTSEGGVDIGTIYLQLALAIKPDFPFALAALANVYEATRRHARANSVYSRIKDGTPLEPLVAIRKAVNLNAMDRTEAAKDVLDKLIARRPKDIKPLEAIGNILRGRKRYREAIGYYTKLLSILPAERKQHWTYWYARGTSYERVKDWASAEKDLLKAMQLDPEQALILNYLGYSWVDQDLNLRRGLKLIEKAVSLKPDDGYIVDSLGWAHYRLGNYKEAAKYLERAVELRPADPILNDHLGDALWHVNRKREARYQWEQALTLKPEKKDEINIRKKLVSGLSLPAGIKAVKGQGKNGAPRKLGKRAESRTETRRAPVQ